MGLKSDVKDCVDANLEEKITCYRQVALTLAAKGDMSKAMQACEKIDPTINANSDSEYFITQKNLCYYDIATVSNNPTACGKISDDNTGSILFGSSATKQMCYKKVENATIAQKQYKCALLFVFPPVMFYAFYANRKNKIS